MEKQTTSAELKKAIRGQYCQLMRRYENELQEEEVEFIDSIIDRTIALCREVVPVKDFTRRESDEGEPEEVAGWNNCRAHILQVFDRIEGKDNK